ncbi:MAG: hypothetical protein J5980_06635 [Muribaculaceae bacterium]|nr:hypothetical protein [Muribaculaceae bacterium]
MKQGFRLTKLLLLLVFFVTTWMACQASTMFVKGTVSPYYKIGDGAYSQMTDYVTASDGVLWYYADVTSGSAVTFASNSSGDNASPAITFASGSNSYFYYNNGTGVNLTSQKTNATCVYFSAGSWWTDANAAFFCHMWGNNAGTTWPGEAGTVVGGTGSTSIIAFAHDFAATGIKFVRLNPDNLTGSGIWNQTTDITGNNLTNGAHYTVTDADSNKAYNSKSETFVVNAWPTRTEAFYLMDNHSGAWNINTGTAFAVNGTSATLNDVELSYGDYFFFSTAQASSADDWSSIAPYRYGPSSGTTTMTSGEPYTAATGNDNSYQPEKSGVWSFDYNLSDNQWTGTITAATTGTKWYLVVSASGGAYLWNHPYEMEQNGSTYTFTKAMTAGDNFIFAQQVGSDWNSSIRYTCNGSADETIVAGTTYTAARHGRKAYIIPTSGNWTFTYNYLSDEWSATFESIDANTGEMYLIGQANGNPWQANMGMKMTASDSKFSLKNVQIIAGAEFAFATKLGENEDDWSGLNLYRYTSEASGSTLLVTNEMTNQENPTLLDLQARNGADKNFKMQSTGRYNITIDWANPSAPTVTIVRLGDVYPALYLLGGPKAWSASDGTEFYTPDGTTYTANMTLVAESTFQFTTQLGESYDAITNYRYGATETGLEIGEHQLNQALTIAKGSNDFVMATSGIFRVVVKVLNGTPQTVTLQQIASVGNETVIHLEKNGKVTNPVLHAYNKEKYNDGTSVHVDRPSMEDLVNTRKELAVNAEDETTTPDGRRWWTWTVDNAITDFFFTRDENEQTSDIQWRRAGEVYFTWPDNGTTMEEYTRDYYAAAAHEIADCAVMLEGHYYAYFTNTPGWNHVFCHAWYNDNGTNYNLLTPPHQTEPMYPGAPCTLVGYDKEGYEVWRYDFGLLSELEHLPTGIIFNNGIQMVNGEPYDYFTEAFTTVGKYQTGDFVAKNGGNYDYCGMISLGRSLGNIIRNGIVDGPPYTIEEELEAVWLDENAETQVEGGTIYGALYCKDLNNFVSTSYVEKSLQQEGEIDYVIDLTGLMGDKTRYDQSNWVKLTLSRVNTEFAVMSKDEQIEYLRGLVGYRLTAETVTGQLVNNVNPEIRITEHPLKGGSSSYSNDNNVNVFVTANFIGSQDGGSEGHCEGKHYFLVTPKPQEYATITWAVYGGDDKFYVPTCHAYTSDGYYAWMNEADLDGYFPVKWDLMKNNNNFEAIKEFLDSHVNDNAEYDKSGQAYQFHAIIRLADEQELSNNKAPRRAESDIPSQPYKLYNGSVKYVVYPIDLTTTGSGIVTAVSETRAARSVESVRYYNLAGMMSSQPFEGVNIIVTTYSDGTNKTSKAIY